MERVEVFCKSIIRTGSAFGLRIDTGEQVFIPPALTRGTVLYEGETREMVIVPNAHKAATTEWFCVRICDRDEAPPAAPPVMSIDDRAYVTVKAADGYLTTAEMSDILKTDTSIAHNALLRLFNQGKIAKADVYGSGGQSRPSFCLWAASARISRLADLGR